MRRADSAIAERDIVAEVDRYIADPGQALGQTIGQFEISRLRREAEQALGQKFESRTFHRVVRRDGSRPMSMIATPADEWIAAEQDAP